MIRVSMEVVSPLKTHFACWWAGQQVGSEGGRDGPVLDLGELFFHRPTNRSFILTNTSDMALDFVLSSSLRSRDQDEVNFSLSRTSMNLIHTLRLQARASATVFLVSQFNDYRGLSPPVTPSDSPSPEKRRDSPPPRPQQPVPKRVEVYVACQLVKDHRLVLPVEAVCRLANFSLSTEELMFTARWVSAEQLLVEQTVSEVVVRNVSEFPVRLQVLCRAKFVQCSGVAADGTVQLDPDETQSLTFRLAEDYVKANHSWISRQRYLESPCWVYNTSLPTERVLVMLKLSTGSLTQFNAIQAIGHPYPFRRNEHEIMSFLRSFNHFWSTHAEQLKAEPTALASLLDSTKFRDISLQLHYVTDELTELVVKKHIGDKSIPLALFLFQSLRASPVLRLASSPLQEMVRQRLNFLLTFFPNNPEGLEELRTYEAELRAKK